MSDKTYQELNLNEVRAIQLTVEDNDGVEFAPSAAYVTINDSQGNTVVSRQAAYTSNNKVTTIIGTITTSAAGFYDVLWEIRKSGYKYYHCTELEVVSVC